MNLRPPDLMTARLVLRTLLPYEVRALVDCDWQSAGRLAGARFPVGWPADEQAREGLVWHLRELERNFTQVAWRVRVAVARTSGQVIGSVNLKGPPDSDGDVEIGWGVEPGHRRLGLAFEAASATLSWAFAQAGVTSVSATIAAHNVSSQRLAARLGMRRCSEARDELPLWRTCVQNAHA